MEEKQDKHLEEKLRLEASGILTWLLEGTARWLKEGLRAPQVVLNATDEYRGEMDVIGVFIKERCVQGPGTFIKARKRGAMVSCKDTPAGPIPYGLNSSYLSTVAPPSLGSAEIRARAFLASHGVLFSLPGLPAVYFHSWVGSEAWTEGPELLGYNRAVNRERLPIDRVEMELDDPRSLRSLIYRGINRFLQFRKAEEAFSPLVAQKVLDTDGAVFALLRGPVENRWGLCVQNLGGSPATVPVREAGVALDRIALDPWETRWIALGSGKRIHLILCLQNMFFIIL